jgi:hypothetical protein
VEQYAKETKRPKTICIDLAESSSCSSSQASSRASSPTPDSNSPVAVDDLSLAELIEYTKTLNKRVQDLQKVETMAGDIKEVLCTMVTSDCPVELVQ